MKKVLEQVKDRVEYKSIIKEDLFNEGFLLELIVDKFPKEKMLNLDVKLKNFSGYEKDGVKIQKIEYAKESVDYKSHQELGEMMELFFFNEKAAAMPFFKEKGRKVYENLQNLSKSSYKKMGYEEIISPMIYNAELWDISGHSKHFRDDMYYLEDGKMAIKPMNCPGHILFYNNQKRNASDLPLRIGELGRVHRKEDSGSVHGLFRVRSFIQDDAHIFCEQSYLKKEISSILEEAISLYNKLGFNSIKINFSSKPEKAVGDDSLWEGAESVLKDVLSNYDYSVKEGDGAFYGPKIDLHLEDSLGREYQVGSIQLDFNLGERFDCVYYDEKGNQKRPIIIHRALFGSLERFLGLLLEHHQGWLPNSISPIEYAIIPVSEKYIEEAKEIGKDLDKVVILSEDSVSKRIKSCYKKRINNIIIVGEKEIESKKVEIKRLRDGNVYNKEI